MNIIYHNSLFYFQEIVDQLEALALLGSEDVEEMMVYRANRGNKALLDHRDPREQKVKKAIVVRLMATAAVSHVIILTIVTGF